MEPPQDGAPGGDAELDGGVLIIDEADRRRGRSERVSIGMRGREGGSSDRD